MLEARCHLRQLPIPVKAAPDPIGYADLRAFFQKWIDDLARAEATLAKVDDAAVKLPLHFGQIHLDITGDGKFDPDEAALSPLRPVECPGEVTRPTPTPTRVKSFLITFDRGDVAWLRGYCHLLIAMSEAYLAHDGQDLLDHTAPLFYSKAKTPFPFLSRRPITRRTAVRDQRWPCTRSRRHPSGPTACERARARMNASLVPHWRQCSPLSRESWKFIVTEADDDHENGCPNPKQHSVLPNVTVSEEMVKGMGSDFIGEARAIVKGRKRSSLSGVPSPTKG